MLEALITAALETIKQGNQPNTNHKIWQDFIKPALDSRQGTEHKTADIEADLTSPDNDAFVRSSLEKYLTGQPDLIDQLQHLLPEASGGSTFLSADDVTEAMDESVKRGIADR